MPKYIEIMDCLEGINLNAYKMPLVLGKTKENKIIFKDLVDLKNLLIVGASGTGKSIFMAGLLYTLTIQNSSPHIRFIFINPKDDDYVKMFSRLPKSKHIGPESIKDVHNNYLSTLRWCKYEMNSRLTELETDKDRKFPYILITITDFADLILNPSGEEESIICELAENGHKANIFIVMYTSRPSPYVLKESIRKAFQNRIAFTLITDNDSMLAIDEIDAVSLHGNGDMIYKNLTNSERLHLQAPITTKREIINAFYNIRGFPQLDSKSK